jgi:hypothetical protein
MVIINEEGTFGRHRWRGPETTPQPAGARAWNVSNQGKSVKLAACKVAWTR